MVEDQPDALLAPRARYAVTASRAEELRTIFEPFRVAARASRAWASGWRSRAVRWRFKAVASTAESPERARLPFFDRLPSAAPLSVHRRRSCISARCCRSRRCRARFRRARRAASTGCTVHARDRRDHQLCDPVAGRDRVRGIAEVDEQHLDLAAIVFVDRAGRIRDGDAVLEREARARPHLAFVPRRQRDREAGRHRGARARLRA